VIGVEEAAPADISLQEGDVILKSTEEDRDDKGF
jgi:hypothetical protein